MPKITKHVFIYGRVQGVGYRAWTQKTARSYELDGWVRNCDDGSVEAVFHGPEPKISDMLRNIENGPLLANVTDIDVEHKSAYDGPKDQFQIKK